jgi:predicted neuraminidase
MSGAARPLLLVLLLAAAGAAYHKVAQRPATASFQLPAASWDAGAMRSGAGAALLRSHFASSQPDISTHAASLVELGDGRIRAFWFAGSREGAPDVQIRSAVFDPQKNEWGPESGIADRADTQRALLRYVKKLGNPVPQRAADGTLWLFYVTVSLGGWAGSSITAISSADDGASWSPARRLVTSPFINISTLVKGTPFLYGDGTMGLPVYHEFIGKFGEILRIQTSGTSAAIIDKQRLSSGKTTLQPVVLIKDTQRALVLMRRSGSSAKRVIATATGDAGRHWSRPAPTALANPDAALTGLVLPDGRMLLALNDLEEGREALSLLLSADGGASWNTVYRLEDQRGRPADPQHYLQTAAALAKATEPGIADPGSYARSAQQHECESQGCRYEFSYPYMIQAKNGDIHLVYTWNRSFIKHVEFTRTWLDQQIAKADDGPLH